MTLEIVITTTFETAIGWALMDMFETYPFDLYPCLEEQEHSKYNANPYREDYVVHVAEGSYLRGRGKTGR